MFNVSKGYMTSEQSASL